MFLIVLKFTIYSKKNFFSSCYNKSFLIYKQFLRQSFSQFQKNSKCRVQNLELPCWHVWHNFSSSSASTATCEWPLRPWSGTRWITAARSRSAATFATTRPSTKRGSIATREECTSKIFYQKNQKRYWVIKWFEGSVV